MNYCRFWVPNKLAWIGSFFTDSSSSVRNLHHETIHSLALFSLQFPSVRVQKFYLCKISCLGRLKILGSSIVPACGTRILVQAKSARLLRSGVSTKLVGGGGHFPHKDEVGLKEQMAFGPRISARLLKHLAPMLTCCFSAAALWIGFPLTCPIQNTWKGRMNL